MKRSVTTIALAAAALMGALTPPTPALAQTAPPRFSPDLFGSLSYRYVGPSRGGRVTAVAGHRAHPSTFYMGATGGGVWKTTDRGHNWRNISDGYFWTGSIGAIRVADSDHNIIYISTGSDGLRSNVIIGDGVYKSTDAGETWQHIGLERTGNSGAVLIHPDDPDLVYVAAIGNPFAPNPERGRVPQPRRGRELGERPLRLGQHRRGGPRVRARRPEHRLRQHVARRAKAMDDHLGRIGGRRLHLARRRRHLEPGHRRPSHRPARKIRPGGQRGGPRPRLRAHRGSPRHRRRLPLRRPWRDLAPGHQLPADPQPALLLHEPGGSSDRSRHPLGDGRGALDEHGRRPQLARPAPPRTATTTICGSIPTTRSS